MEISRADRSSRRESTIERVHRGEVPFEGPDTADNNRRAAVYPAQKRGSCRATNNPAGQVAGGPRSVSGRPSRPWRDSHDLFFLPLSLCPPSPFERKLSRNLTDVAGDCT